MKQAARSGFCFVLVLGMKLCTHDSTALSPDLYYCGESVPPGFPSFFSQVSLDFVFLRSTYLCLPRRCRWNLALVLAFGYRQGTVADGEAFMRRPLETPEE